jgi:hypothetical protein
MLRLTVKCGLTITNILGVHDNQYNRSFVFLVHVYHLFNRLQRSRGTQHQVQNLDFAYHMPVSRIN